MGIIGIAFKYLLAGIVGFLIGVVSSVILLTKKNFETYQKITKEVESRYETGKGVYNAMVYGSSSDDDDEEDEEYEEDEENKNNSEETDSNSKES